METNVKRGSTSLAVKVGFWYVVSTFLAKSLSFITTPLFSRMMSESDYGEFMNFASWLTTLFIVTSLEMFNTLPRAYYDYTDEFDQYNSSVTIASCGLAVIFYGLFLISGEWIYEIVSIPIHYVHILFVVLMFQAGKQIYLARERTMYRYKSVVCISLINLIIPTVIAVILVGLLPVEYRLSGRIYGTYVPIILINLFCVLILLKKRITFKIEHLKYAFKLSLPLFVHFFTAYLLISTNVIVTKSVQGAQAAAVVSIATSVLHILTVLFEALTGAVTTWVMDNLQQGNGKKLYHDSMFYISGLAVVAIGTILFAPEIVWILGGAKYASATPLIPFLVVAVFIQAITSLFTVILTYEKKIVKTAIFTATVAVISIVGKIVLMPKYGIDILPTINVVTFGVLFVLNYILVRKTSHCIAINIKGTVAVIMSTGVLAFFSSILYTYTLMRYIVVGTIAVVSIFVILKYRKTLLDAVKKVYKRS